MKLSVLSLQSQKLDHLHCEIMALIDEVGRYGRSQAPLVIQAYAPEIAKFYTKQMRRLSARLYQIAALLLLQRAGHEGDMKCEDVAQESSKIYIEQILPDEDNPAWKAMEANFCQLNQKSLELACQAWHMIQSHNEPTVNMPHQHFRQIEEAFSKRSKHG